MAGPNDAGNVLEVFPDLGANRRRRVDARGSRPLSLAEQFGTPLVVYCEETLRMRARSLREAVGPKDTSRMASRHSRTSPLMRLLREEGVGADVAFDRRAPFAEAAGFEGAEIVVHGNNKDAAFLRRRGGRGATVVLDAPDEAELAAAAGVQRVLVRVTLGVDADTHEAIRTGHHGSKFGLPPRPGPRADRGRARARPRRAGLHVHVGSQLADFDAQAETIVRLASFAASCRDELGWTARMADLGGGFGIRHNLDEHAPDAAVLAASAVETARLAFAEAGLATPEVWLEPGRSLVGTAGVTLYRVGAVKRLPERTWVAVDGGMSDNPRPQLYDAVYTALSADRADEAATERVSIAGMHCESGDVLIDDVSLPAPRRGDLLAVPGHGRIHARDGVELQRRHPPCGGARRGRRRLG